MAEAHPLRKGWENLVEHFDRHILLVCEYEWRHIVAGEGIIPRRFVGSR
jgi:hypothetical protein